MAQPPSAPPPQCHCPDCLSARSMTAQLGQPPPMQVAPEEAWASSSMQPSAPAPSFVAPQLAPHAAQALAAPPPAPLRAPLLARAAQPPPAHGAQQLAVLVPSGIAAGQHLQFTTPDGQSMFVTVPRDCPPNSQVMVQYQPWRPLDQGAHLAAPRPGAGAVPGPVGPLHGPGVPLPGLAAAAAAPPLPGGDSDARGMNIGWALYGLGWLLCFVVPPLALVLWISLAVPHFCCRSPQLRAQRPRQRGPAVAAAATCLVLAAIAAVGAVVGGGFMPEEAAARGDGHLIPHRNHSHRGRPRPPGPLEHHRHFVGEVPHQRLRGAVLAGKPLFDSVSVEGLVVAGGGSLQQSSVVVSAALAGPTVVQGPREVIGVSEAPGWFSMAVHKVAGMWAAKKEAHHEAMKKWTGHVTNYTVVEGAEEEAHKPCALKAAAEKFKQQWVKLERPDVLE
ncbi:unnamed protein product [Prorocentrum cordatum]|uniref:Uncharacterized protein n=1 Tax=Prorocentrum cordatum TaxID=2364126 RepID=A0ABN9SCT7_9DINO|nr:unnamed protein product [Polarella glacialis]